MQWEVEPTGARIAQLATDLTARIDALDPESDTPVYSDFTFSIAVADWTLANGVYTARVNNTVLLTENAGIQVFYDASLRTGLVGDIFADKHTGYIDFTTTLQPVGAISGIIRVLDSVSGMLSVAKGGTGAATPKKARENLNTPIRDIPVDFGTVSSLPQTIYDADITANMVAFDATFSNPVAVPDGIDVTFAAGSVTITGTITSGQETTIKFWCHEKRTAVEGTESSSAEPRVNEFVHVGAQTLTAEQQTQVRTNLGAASASDVAALNSNLSKIGTILIGTNANGNVSVPNNTATIISTITLDKGNWLLIGSVDWQANATGYRQVSFGDGNNPSRRYTSTIVGIADKEAYNQAVSIESISSSTTYNLYARQNSGSSLTAYPALYAIRISG